MSALCCDVRLSRSPPPSPPHQWCCYGITMTSRHKHGRSYLCAREDGHGTRSRLLADAMMQREMRRRPRAVSAKTCTMSHQRYRLWPDCACQYPDALLRSCRTV
jgi:hypothetical protein